MRRTLHAAAAALQFLTRIPVGPLPWSDDLLGRSALFFPVVGAVVGGGAAIVNWLAQQRLNDSLRAVAVLAFLVMITGGLHEDALADVADGLGGRHTREKSLAIMRDSRIGSFGATALGLALLARYALIASLPPGRAGATLIGAHVLCRWTALPLAAYLPPARGNDGQGASFGLHVPHYAVLGGTVIAAVLTASLLGKASLLPLLVAAALVVVSGWYYRHRLGGITGDCLGAANQVTEIAIYACAVLVHS
jgi:adenosylcobinamide-GDP ribazoletransferase